LNFVTHKQEQINALQQRKLDERTNEEAKAATEEETTTNGVF